MIDDVRNLGEYIEAMQGRLERSYRWSLRKMREVVAETLTRTGSQARADGNPITCGGLGCSGCCRGEVAITRREWDALLPLIDRDALQRAWDDRAALLDPERQRFARCALLDPATDACIVYDERPLVCRGYHAVTPRDWCWPERAGKRLIASYPEPLGVVGAIYASIVENGGSMPHSLSGLLVREAARQGVTDAS